MMKNVKRTLAALFSICIAFSSVFAVSAESSDKLMDDADLYSASEESAIRSNLEEASDITGWDVIIYTNRNGVDSDEMENYCNDYYDDHNFGCGSEMSGIFLTIDMNSREMYIITKGDAMYYFNDDRVDDILDDVQYALMDDEYFEAAVAFIEDTVNFHNQGKPTSGTFSNVELEEKTDNPLLYVIKHYGVIILLVAMGVAAIVAVSVKLKYKNNGKENVYDLAANSRVNLTESEDMFLDKRVSVTTVSSSSGGGRRGGGGGGRSSHGGGGRSF